MSSFPFGKSIFGDVDVDKINLHLQKDFIIQRVFSRGGMKDVKIVFSLYPIADEALKKSRELDKLTHNFCSNYFNIPKEEMNALCEFYQ